MTSALRRSRRAIPTKNATYHAGDIVEVTRNNTTLNARLVCNLSEGGPSSTNPLWRVEWIDAQHKQEPQEVYERFFGKVLKDIPTTTKTNTTMPPPSIRRSSKHSLSSASNSEADEEPPKKQRRVTFSDQSTASPTASDGESSSNSGGVSARAQRSQRRQAIMEEQPIVYTARKPTTGRHAEPKFDDKDVVVVKLLTGTLYLYKGAHRRAEFVRRV